MAQKTPTSGRTVYVPTDSFVAELDGVEVTFREGETTVDEDHPILAKYPHLFKPQPVRYTVEQATAAPGERRVR